MLDSSTITLPETMPLSDRISEVSKQISEWLESLESPFDGKTDALQLINYERKGKKFTYQYSIDRDVRNIKGSSPYKSVGK